MVPVNFFGENPEIYLDPLLQPSITFSVEIGRASAALDHEIVEPIPEEGDFRDS